jgi:hypothetical protein
MWVWFIFILMTSNNKKTMRIEFNAPNKNPCVYRVRFLRSETDDFIDFIDFQNNRVELSKKYIVRRWEE